MKNKFVASVFVPPIYEGGDSVVGGCILNAGEMKTKKVGLLVDKLPKEARITHGDGVLHIEVDLPHYGKTRRGINTLARRISSAIRRAIGSMPGVIQMDSSQKILAIVRRG